MSIEKTLYNTKNVAHTVTEFAILTNQLFQEKELQ